MGKNAYAAKMMAAKAAMSRDQKKALIHRCLTTIYQASAVALNNEFGFGPDRITRFREAMENVINEYGVEMQETDAEFADGKLEEAYLRVMGQYYEKKE